MQIKRFKITAVKIPGYMMVVYQDGHFKSVLNEFPQITEKQLNLILNHLTEDSKPLIDMLKGKFGNKLIVEEIKNIGTEPAKEHPVNKKIARFCELFEAKAGVKYKVSSSDAGKIAALSADEAEWEKLLLCYFNSDNFLFKNKWSIANLAKYFNELRVEALGKPVGKNYPIPYDHDYFGKCSYNDQKEYWQALRDAGYMFEANATGRGGKWIKKPNLINQ